MPSDIEVRDGEAKMVYAGEVPWHGLGTRVDEAMTSEEAIVLAGLDWDVKLGALYGPRPPKGQPWVKLDDRVAIYRTDNYEVLGIATPEYHPYANRECFGFVDSLVADGLMRYEAAFGLAGGKQICLLGRLEEDWTIADERHTAYIMLTTRHDTGGALTVVPTDVRAICANTIRLALRTAATRLRMVHRPNMEQKMAAAAAALAITTGTMTRYKALMELAQQYRLADGEYDALETGLVGSLDEATGKQRRERIEAFRAIYAAEVEVNGPTAYTLVNAATGFADHVGRNYSGSEVKKAETRFLYTQASSYPGTELKAEALALVGELSPDLKTAYKALADAKA